MANYFISDLHFGHKNVLSFDDRPWTNIEDHDNFIIQNWNDTVSYEDDVYILGDVSWHNATKTNEIFKQLNGTKHLIIGNHDGKLLKNREFQQQFQEICYYKELPYTENKIIVLCHYPIPCFNKHYYGSYHLYGHVHNGFEENMMRNIRRQMQDLYDVPSQMYNVGIMMPWMEYHPQTLEDIISSASIYIDSTL